MVLAWREEEREKAHEGCCWKRHCDERGLLRGRVVRNREEENCLRDAKTFPSDVSGPCRAVNLANRLMAWLKEGTCDAMMDRLPRM